MGTRSLIYHDAHRLSTTGSTRGTAYRFSNKSVAIGECTHVVWLDAVATVCSATWDSENGEWSESRRLFDGCDNHTSPAITVDADGRIHLLYGPHGFWGGWNQGRFKHRVSVEPNDSTLWHDETDVGYCATYPSITHTSEGLDVIAYRGGEAPWQVMVQRQRKTGAWSSAQPIIGEDLEPQYTHLGAWVHATHNSGRRNTVLFLGAHLYAKERENSRGVVLFRSDDLGDSWCDVSGTPVETPTRYHDAVMIPHPTPGRFCGVAADPDGNPWVLTATKDTGNPAVLLSRWCNGNWESDDLARWFPTGWVCDYPTLSVGTDGTIFVAAAATPSKVAPEEVWGHPTHEVFLLSSTDGGGRFSCEMVSDGDPNTANWLPALSHGGIYHPVDAPVVLYTKGVRGEGCSPETTTEIFCVRTEWA